MSSNIYKAVCARLLQVDFTQRINLCCLCLEMAGKTGASVDDEVALNPHAGHPGHGIKLCDILKFLMGESFSEVIFVLKSVCKECMSSAISGYKFILSCQENFKKLAEVVDNIEESFEELIPLDKMNYKSLYVAIQPCNESKAIVKRYYDRRLHLVPEDTAFSRFSQIIVNKEPDENQMNIPTDRKQNIEINEMDQTLQALMCCKTVTDIKELLDNPNKPNQFKCRICKELFGKSTSLRVHFYRSHRNKDFKCVKCKAQKYVKSKFFKQNQPLVLLDRLKIADNEDPLKFQQKVVLDDQLDETNADDDDQYEEPNLTEDMEKHQDEIRVVPTKVLLEDKKPKNNSPSDNTEGQYIVENKTNTDNCCTNCGMTFSTRARYLTHKKKYKNDSCHRRRGRGNFKCDLCNFTAFYKHLVSKHIRFEHLGVKGHVCSYCNRNCYSKGELEIHLRKHTGEKPYRCSTCGGKFASSNGLKHHTYIHTGERPYKCEYCKQTFRTGTSRGEHIARFHKPALLSCKICGHMFKVKIDLVRHEIRHHAIQPIRIRKKYQQD